MNLSRVDLNLLLVFEVIYTEGGVTKAAQQLNLTQPAISHALGRLREIFDDPLFNRQGHVMAPTPMARSLIEPVRRALQMIDAVVRNSGRFDPTTAKRLFTIGLLDVMEPVALPPLLKFLTETAPDIDVSSVRVNRSTMEKDLASGALDLAVDVLIPTSQDIQSALISGDRLVVVARRGHPHVGPGLTLETYLKQEHILVSSRRQGWGIADREISRDGHHRRIRLRNQQCIAACRVVSETDLVLTMPIRYARIANLLFDNQLIEAPFDGPSQDVYLYWHANAEHDPANRWLRDQLFSAFDPDRDVEEFNTRQSVIRRIHEKRSNQFI